MIDPFDYKEPACALCGGKEFYNPSPNDPIGTIPVARIIEKVDLLFDKNNLDEAGRLLEYWNNEAIALNDLRGELSISDELVGFYRKTGDKNKALVVVERCIKLINVLLLENTISAGTIFLNCATTLKAFGEVKRAIPLYDLAQDIYTKSLDKNDEKLAGFYNNKGLALVDLGEYDKAIDCYDNAIKIGLNNKNGYLNVAITYVNLAHAYESAKAERQVIIDSLFKAYNVLVDEKIQKNGYYAFVLSKCAPSFKHFGFDKIASEFELTVREIYERN